jgi:Amt family ammonium transporter
MKFKSFLIFGVLWVTLIYDPVAHWVWAPGGWLRNMGALDFAGGTVVHICSGISALACALVMGRRRGYGREDMSPHNMTMTVVGASLLWFGWFGFNAGSALAANGIAVNALVVTNTSAAAAALSWMLIEWMHKGKPSMFGVATGAVAGLVAITPASGYVGPMAAVVIGLLVSLFSYAAIELKGILGYDDSLDVFGVHGVGGMWGAVATGLFASLAINPAGGNGLLHGNARLFFIQLIAVLAVAAYSFAGTTILLKVTHAFSDLRVSEEEEHAGLDLSQHGEIGYLI